jgi:integrase
MSRAGSTRLYKRGEIWWCWGTYIDGTRWSASTKQRDKRAAEIAARVIERERATAVHAPAPAVTVADGIHALRASLRRGERAVATSAYYDRKLGHIVRLLGASRALESISDDDVSAYIDARQVEGAARTTIAKELNALRTCQRRRRVTPIEIPPELVGAYVPRKRWMPAEEFGRLVAKIAPSRRDHLIAYAYLGVRDSELYVIHPEHVDLARGLVHVKGTKTDGADRTLPIAPSLRPTLERLVKERPVGAPIFEPWGNARRDLNAACKRAEIAPVSLNDIRRTFASWLANAGVPELVAAKLLGHKSTRMVSQVYAQIHGDSTKAAVALLPAVAAVVANGAPVDGQDALRGRKAMGQKKQKPR